MHELLFLNELCKRFLNEKGELAFNILLDYGKSRYRRCESDLSVVCKAIVLSIGLAEGKNLELEELAGFGSERFGSCSFERLLNLCGVVKWHLLRTYVPLEIPETSLNEWVCLHSAKLGIPTYIVYEAISLAGALLTKGQDDEFEMLIKESKGRSVVAASLICAASTCMGKPILNCVSEILGIEKEALEKLMLLILKRTSPLGPRTIEYITHLLERIRESQKPPSLIERCAIELGFGVERKEGLNGRSFFIIRDKNREVLIMKKRRSRCSRSRKHP